MKVLGVNGSSRKDGNTALIMKIVFEELEKEGIETEMIQFSGNIIEPCKGCFACKGKNNCVFKKDMFYLNFAKYSHLYRWEMNSNKGAVALNK